jgi:hypothetical protein
VWTFLWVLLVTQAVVLKQTMGALGDTSCSFKTNHGEHPWFVLNMINQLNTYHSLYLMASI